jgi:diacylglycerol kinase (ATP)
MRKKRKERERPPFFDSLNCAVEGLVYVIKTQRNMQVHLAISVFVLIAGILLHLDGTDFILVSLAIVMVLFSEMINTAIELQVDLISEKYHPIAKIIKDICAGAVLVSSLFAILVGYLIVAKKFDQPIQEVIHGIQASPWNISLICLVGVVVASILIKALLHRGTPFHGGMPSAHTGVAFAIWMLVTLIAESTLVSALTLFAAVLVAQSRVALKAHTLWEVAAGALLGALTTLFLYQLITAY